MVLLQCQETLKQDWFQPFKAALIIQNMPLWFCFRSPIFVYRFHQISNEWAEMTVVPIYLYIPYNHLVLSINLVFAPKL